MDYFTQATNLDSLTKLLKTRGIDYNYELISKAYKFAEKIYANKQRLSGDSYLVHATIVAGYAAQLNLDSVSIVVGLLHDSVEKADVSIDLIDREFGTEIAFIVDGLTNIQKLTKGVNTDNLDKENLKHLIFNATEDIRILIIRILEKFHNLQNINNLDQNIVEKSATKALNIYAPLAEYLGLGYLQRSLEDLSFKILRPEEYNLVISVIEKHFSSSQKTIDDFLSEAKRLLEEYNVEFSSISSRKKSIYSTYKKAKRKLEQNETLSEETLSRLKDIHAARLILKNVEDCYLVLGLVHSKWEYVKEEFDDYISRPKPNGYRSLQTAIVFKDTFFEVQIRTEEMHQFNEFGPASHIAYKLKGSTLSKKDNFTWTEDLVKWKTQSELTKDDFKISVFSQSIFVFTPKGLIIRLDKDATPIDFAFRVHTEIGYCYTGAKVNGKMVNMSYKLKTGDIIEILTSKKRNVTLDWIKSAKMNETKSRIRRHFNNIR